MILESICGFDINDSTSKNITKPTLVNNIGKSIKGMKIGIPKEYQKYCTDSQMKKYWEKAKSWLIDAGAEPIDISLPHSDYALSTYYIIATAEASSNLAKYDAIRYGVRIQNKTDSFQDMLEKTRDKCFGEEVKKRILSGTYVLTTKCFKYYYQKAQKIRKLICNDFVKAFDKAKVILTPTTLNHAFEITKKSNHIDLYKNDLFTVPSSLAGLPCISIPVGISYNKLPLGIQLISKNYDEENLFKFANIIEKNSEFNIV